MVSRESVGKSRGDRLGLVPVLGAILRDEVVREWSYVLDALPQRRQRDRDDVQAIEEVFAEVPGGDRARQVAVARGDDAGVRGQRLVRAHAVVCPLLQDAQELGLQVERHFADLVEQERAAFGLLESSSAIRDGAGKRSAHVSEEFALQQCLRDGGAIHRDERGRSSVAVGVDGSGDEFLARPALAREQHGDVALRDAADGLVHVLHEGAVADDLVAFAGLGRGDALRFPRVRGGGLLLDGRYGAAGKFLNARNVERFGDVVEGVSLGRFEGGSHRAVGGQDDDRDVGMSFV